MMERQRSLVGRPEVTTHADIEQAAFRLFRRHGFEGTTLDSIAAQVGVGRRTLFRYYSSKNDIPWGQFDRTLDGFRAILDSMPTSLPLHVAVHRGVVAFNEFPADARPTHRERMQLILETPALRAHSMLRYAEWRAVIAEFVAERRGLAASELLPQMVSQVSLALALAAYDEWLRRPATPLSAVLDAAMGELQEYLTT